MDAPEHPGATGAPAPAPAPGPDRAPYRLEITDGPQRGASAPLDPDASPTLGSSTGADLCLSDARVPALALAFERGADGAPLLRPLAGGLRRDGVALEGDGPHPHVDGARYEIGATGFVLTATGTAPGATGRIDEESAVALPHVAAARGTTPEPHAVPRAALAAAVALLLCIGVGASWLLHRSAPESVPARPVAAVPSPDLAERLAAAGFGDVSLVIGADGTARLEGYVDTRERLQELARLARAEPPPIPAVRVHVQPEIVEAVRDVYRTNGLRASVESDGPGAVRVRTNEPESHDPERLRHAAMQDVPGLLALDDANVPPPAPPTPEPAAPRVGRDPPGKRVVAVVGGDPGYVVTADESRYFVGSALPSGHVIVGIEGETVVLERSGTTTELSF